MNLEKTQNTKDYIPESLTLEQKISLIKQKLGIIYLEEEMKGFDKWLNNIPENSKNNPITISNLEDIQNLLPVYSNYKENEKINIFLKKENIFLDIELNSILKNFSDKNPSFEISIVKHDDNLISIGIGNKTRNSSTILDPNGEYFGHYHPTGFNFENEQELPDSFIAGLMPSFGDIKGYLKHTQVLKAPTRIFSKYGYSKITRVEEKNERLDLDKIKNKYFDLFLGENKFNLKTDKEIADSIKDELGLKIEFHYFDEKKVESKI